MANRPFEYTIINPLERPTSTDINQLQAQAHYDVRQFAYELFARQNGFLGYSFNPEPADPADGTFWIQQGVAFQYGPVENTFGTPAIPGLVDSYRQKAVTIANRNFTAATLPSVSGHKRYDLLMIRAPAGDERLANSQQVGIFNPTSVNFGAQEKYKTLTSSLTDFVVEYILASETPTTPLVYKTGVEFTGAWNPANKPSVDTGYLGVAYIKRYFGQTSITASDIEDARTLLTVPAQSGGTGNKDPAFYTGSVAWFDTAEGKIKYTQAVEGLYDTPVSGYLLASNASGEPTWVAPGTAGQVLTSNGTAWEASDLPGGSISYLSSSTHLISNTANFVEVVCIGGGGGGGGGARSDIAGEAGSGGGGGGGGGLTRIVYSAADLRTLGSSLTITVGLGGTGGAGAAAVNTNGSNGSAGGDTNVFIGSSQIALATGGSGGEGGYANTTSIADGGLGGAGAAESGTQGGNGTYESLQKDSLSTTNGAATGGGAGGGYDNPYPLSGGAAGNSGTYTRNLTGGAGGSSGDSGAAGADSSFGIAGTGGGGGGAEDGTSGGAGGIGGAGGGGGGGGGYCRMTTAASGSGGNGGTGGNGRVIIREW